MTHQPSHAAFAAGEEPSELYRQWREVSDRIDAEDAAKAAARARAGAVPAACLTAPTDALGRTLRHDGWTPDRQRAFLCAIADGLTVERACRLVQMTVSSAYALRQRAVGAAFALGWRAAQLLARDRVADDLLARAMDGQVETVTRADGATVSRHKYDNRTAMALLARLDRMVESAPADPAAAADRHAARLVAQDWEAYLDMLERDPAPARAGLFLARRTDLAGAPQGAPALEPVLALARADAFVRTGASLPQEVDTADLDLTARAAWTAEQWLRAEAAGLLRVAPEPEPATNLPDSPPHPPLVRRPDAVWWDEDAEEYRTGFAPPADEQPEYESGRYPTDCYERSLTEREAALMNRAAQLDTAEMRADAAERDAWFAHLEAEIAAAEAELQGVSEQPGDPAAAPSVRAAPAQGLPPEGDGAAALAPASHCAHMGGATVRTSTVTALCDDLPSFPAATAPGDPALGSLY